MLALFSSNRMNIVYAGVIIAFLADHAAAQDTKRKMGTIDFENITAGGSESVEKQTTDVSLIDNNRLSIATEQQNDPIEENSVRPESRKEEVLEVVQLPRNRIPLRLLQRNKFRPVTSSLAPDTTLSVTVVPVVPPNPPRQVDNMIIDKRIGYPQREIIRPDDKRDQRSSQEIEHRSNVQHGNEKEISNFPPPATRTNGEVSPISNFPPPATRTNGEVSPISNFPPPATRTNGELSPISNFPPPATRPDEELNQISNFPPPLPASHSAQIGTIRNNWKKQREEHVPSVQDNDHHELRPLRGFEQSWSRNQQSYRHPVTQKGNATARTSNTGIIKNRSEEKIDQSVGSNLTSRLSNDTDHNETTPFPIPVPLDNVPFHLRPRQEIRNRMLEAQWEKAGLNFSDYLTTSIPHVNVTSDSTTSPPPTTVPTSAISTTNATTEQTTTTTPPTTTDPVHFYLMNFLANKNSNARDYLRDILQNRLNQESDQQKLNDHQLTDKQTNDSDDFRVARV